MSRKHMVLFLSIWVWEVTGMFHFHFYKKMLISTKCLWLIRKKDLSKIKTIFLEGIIS